MRRATSPWLVLLVLVLVGLGIAFLGARLAVAEADARAREAREHLRAVLASVPRLMALELSSPTTPATGSWRVLEGLAPVPLVDGERLRLDEAAWRHAHAETPVAIQAWASLEATGSPGARAVAALRLAAVLRTGAPDRATVLLDRAARANGTWTEDGVPVALAAKWLRADIERSTTPLVDAARRRWLSASGEGHLLGPEGTLGPDALLIGEAGLAATRGLSEAPVEQALEAARRTAREGRLWRDLLPAEGGVRVQGSVVGWRSGSRLQTRPATALLEPVARASGTPLRLAHRHQQPAEGALRTDALTPPLESFVAEVVPQAAERGWPIHVPWLVGLAVYALGAALAFLAFQRHARAARMQGDFVAAVSHELKTPIASVRAMAELLSDGVADDPAKTRLYAERIESEMTRLGTTVRNVLDASRVEQSGALALARAAADPAIVVEEALAGLRPLLARRGFRVEVDVSPAARPLLLDPQALRGVLVNLIDNAMKYAGPGRTVSVRGHDERGGYAIEVADDGVGLPPGDPERLFERFHRGAGARDAAIPGIGLGLFVARQVAAAHGGTIRADAVPGGGARFILWLPPAQDEVPA